MRVRARKIFVLAGLAAISCSSAALAFDTAQLSQGGSLLLKDLERLIAQSPALKREIDAALAQAGKTGTDTICGGKRFSGRWQHLGGYRVSPYICTFADDRFLEIRATVRITSAGGKAYTTFSPEAMAKARHIQERHPTWTWLKKDPRAD